MTKEANFEIIPRKCTNGRPTKRPSLDILREEYLTLSTREMAMKYNVGESTVRNWVYKARRGYFNK